MFFPWKRKMMIIDRNYEMMIFNVRYQKANQRQASDLLTLQSKNNESAQLRQVSDQISLGLCFPLFLWHLCFCFCYYCLAFQRLKELSKTSISNKNNHHLVQFIVFVRNRIQKEKIPDFSWFFDPMNFVLRSEHFTWQGIELGIRECSLGCY